MLAQTPRRSSSVRWECGELTALVRLFQSNGRVCSGAAVHGGDAGGESVGVAVAIGGNERHRGTVPRSVRDRGARTDTAIGRQFLVCVLSIL